MLWIIFLGDEQRKEERVDAAFPGPWEIDLAILHAIADVPAVIELTVDHVDMGIEDERLLCVQQGN
jgi:hypothetical protein